VKVTGTSKSIVMISAESGTPVELASIPLAQTTVRLKADCNDDKKADKAYFYYSLDGQTWTAVADVLLFGRIRGLSLFAVQLFDEVRRGLRGFRLFSGQQRNQCRFQLAWPRLGTAPTAT
jgi:hypothetical protein